MGVIVKRPPSTPVQNRVIDDYKDGQIALSEALQMLAGGNAKNPQEISTPLATKERLLSILSELDELVGLSDVKKTVREIFAYIHMQQERQQQGLKADPVVLHMVFQGNPGTGKTTVARLLAKMFHECGLLERGHLVEVERADLVGEYIGHTAQKTRELIKRAIGGVLFIDEAYSLARGGEKDFGREAIDCLVKGMEDYRNQFIAIIAGYEQEMKWFLSTNPGLPSRFPIHLRFPDYEPQALVEIARRTAISRQYRLSREAETKLRTELQKMLVGQNAVRNFSNARFVRNAIERAIRLHAVRLFEKAAPSREDLMILQAEDLRWEGAL